MRTADEKRVNFEGGCRMAQDDLRGTHQNRPFKLPENVITSVKNHIDSFPVMDSHYCHAETNRKYFEEGLSARKMHRMYVADIVSKDPDMVVSEQMYRKILGLHGSFGFFVPKNDR